MLTRQHFTKFADIMVQLCDDIDNTDALTINNTVDYLCEYFHDNNPNFDEHKFRDYINKNTNGHKLEQNDY